MMTKCHEYLTVNVKTPSKIKQAVYTFASVFIFLLSLFFAAQKLEIFKFEIIIFIELFFAITAFCVIFIFAKRLAKILILLAIFAVTAYYCYANFNGIITGIGIIVSDVLELYNNFFNKNIITILPTFTFHPQEYHTNMVLIPFVILISGYMVWRISKGKGIFFTLLLFGTVFWASLNLSYHVDTGLIIFVLIGFFMIVCNSTSYQNGVLINIQNGTIALLLSIAILICAISAGISSLKTEYSAPLEDFAQDPQKLVSMVDLSRFNKLNFGAHSYGIGSGEFSRTGSQKMPTGETHLTVTSKELFPTYFSGYIGSKYTQNGWKNFDNDVYKKAAPMFNNLYENKFTPHTITNGFLSEYNDFSDVDFQNHTYIIENKKANNSYMYIPEVSAADQFNSTYFSESDFLFDTAIRNNPFNIKPYETANYVIDFKPQARINNTDNTVEKSLESYIKDGVSGESKNAQAVLDYEKFVYENYLDLPDNSLDRIKSDAAKLLNKAEQKEEWKNGGNKTVLCCMEVEEFLKAHAVYDLSPGAVPANEDFTEHFLYESHRGYCVHFATAATLLLRAMGIPARYTEGYVLTRNDIDAAEKSLDIIDGKTANIPDKNAHAWTQVWQDGGNSSLLGWIRFDFTPGFTDEETAPPINNAQVTNDILETAHAEEVELAEQAAESSVSSESLAESLTESLAESASASSDNSESLSDSLSSGEDVSSIEDKVLKEPQNFHSKIIIIVIFSCFCIIFIIFAAFFSARKIALKRRQKGFSVADKNAAFCNTYIYVLKLLKFISLTVSDNESEEEFAKRANCKNLLAVYGDNGFYEFTQKALMASFSSHTITQNECDFALTNANALAQNIYTDCGFIKKLEFLYIKLL